VTIENIANTKKIQKVLSSFEHSKVKISDLEMPHYNVFINIFHLTLICFKALLQK